MTDEDLAAEVVASAVLRGNDRTLRIAAARLLDFQPMVPLSFAYRVGDLVLRATQPPFTVTSNGDHPDVN
jgi:hypothetical protein